MFTILFSEFVTTLPYSAIQMSLHVIHVRICQSNIWFVYVYDIACFVQAVTKMVQEAYTYVEKTPNMEIKLKLIDTLRTITAGKVNTIICTLCVFISSVWYYCLFLFLMLYIQLKAVFMRLYCFRYTLKLNVPVWPRH